MPSLFSAALTLCGLSHREAAAFLNVRPDTVKSWSAGRNPVPAGAMAELHRLSERMDEAAENVADLFDEHAPAAAVEIGIASDDHEARSLGWPCVGAQMALAARVWSLLPEGVTLRLVPRGSTVATAAAADEHDKAR